VAVASAYLLWGAGKPLQGNPGGDSGPTNLPTSGPETGGGDVVAWPREEKGRVLQRRRTAGDRFM